MKSLFAHSGCVATLLLIVSGASAQEDLRPLIDSDSEVKSDVQPADAEDIPPPSPVPDPGVAIPQPRPATPADFAPATAPAGGEQKAYDFGISYVPTEQGMNVRGVIVGSRAAAAGVQPNDIIVSVNGNAPTSDALQQNQVESLEVVRGNSRQSLRVGAVAPQGNAGAAAYVPDRRTAYSVPRGTSEPRSTYRVPQSAYRVPQATYRASPRTYRYSPSYDERYAPGYIYRPSRPPYAYRSYRGYDRPRVSIGYGTGGYFGPGLGGYRGIGIGGPGYGYGRYGGFGYGRRSGISISFGF